MGQKDLSEKILLAYNDVFADVVNVLFFHGKCEIQPEELENSEPRFFYKNAGELHELERDVLKCWKKEDIRFACIGIENQTVIDADMTFRVIGYDGAAYRAQLSGKERYPVTTIVLYFGYDRKWDKPLSLHERLGVSDKLSPFVNDYKINLFEVAYLSDEQVNLFQSDFKIVADYFVQKRKKQNYIPSKLEMKHVEAVLQLLSVMEKDNRFMDAVYKTDGGKVENMCDVLDRVEQRGIQVGIERGETAKMTKIVEALYRKGYMVKEIAKMIDESEQSVKNALQLI